LFGGMMEKLRTMSLVKKKKPSASVPLNKLRNLQPRDRPDALATLNDKAKMVDFARIAKSCEEIGSWMVWVIPYRHSDTVSILVVVCSRE
jgi:hypothetical protein